MASAVYWFDRPPMEGVVKQGSFRAYGHTIGPTQRALQAWVNGNPLTDHFSFAEEFARREDPAFRGDLQIVGEKSVDGGGLHWSVRFAQAGYPSRRGLASGSSAEDACDHACDLVREEERERAEAASLMPRLG